LATLSVAKGVPVVLVGADAAALGEVVARGPDREGRERMLAVMVGDPGDAAVWAAAREMGAELNGPFDLPGRVDRGGPGGRRTRRVG
jgi:hypothetical protein